MRSKEQPAELRDRVMSRHRSGESYTNKFCCIEEHTGLHKFWMEEVWNSQISSQSWLPGLTEQLLEKGLTREVTKNLMVTLAELQKSYGGNLQKDNHHCNTPPIWALWQSGQTEASTQWKTHESLLGVCKKAPKGLSRLWETRFSGLMKPRFNCLA